MPAIREELENVYSMFSDQTDKMPISNLENAVRSAGYVIDSTLIQTVTSSYLTFPEFVEFVNYAQENEISKEKIEESFKFFDPEGTGLMKASDFKQILLTGKDPLGDDDINSILEMFPPNSEGLICYSLPINYVFDE